MKKFSISISYPPLFFQDKTPFLSQNRQFQWTNTGNVIYPVIPAYAATLLKNEKYKVFWDDGIAENISYNDWFTRLIKRKPNLIAIETKTPVIKQHWEIISEIKKKLPKSKIVLMGDHITALPQESIKNSPVDFVLIGGDYDFLLLELVKKIYKKEKIKSKIFKLSKKNNLDLLPIIDRNLTKWKLYAYNNTNYKYKPGAYIMSGRDCWWGKCTFCSWTTLFPKKCYRIFSVKHTIAEIENLANNHNVKEIFDDSGTLPTGKWLENLCFELIKKKLNKIVRFSCNMRFGSLNKNQYLLMKKAGFRFILYGLESGNQKTLNKINKNLNLKTVERELKIIKKIGLNPHLTIMVGYPWESKKDINKTVSFVKNICKKGLVDSLQATIVIPYPGTPLFKECNKKNILTTNDWSKYDMSQSVIKSELTDIELKNYIKKIFKILITPKYIFKKIISIQSIDDFKQLFFYGFKFFQKLKDFSNQND